MCCMYFSINLNCLGFLWPFGAVSGNYKIIKLFNTHSITLHKILKLNTLPPTLLKTLTYQITQWQFPSPSHCSILFHNFNQLVTTLTWGTVCKQLTFLMNCNLAMWIKGVGEVYVYMCMFEKEKVLIKTSSQHPVTPLLSQP